MSISQRPGGLVPSAVLALALATSVEAQPLRTGAGAYFLFAMRSANVKDLDVLSPCNVAVDCARPSSNSSCGTTTLGDSLLADGSQLAADVARFNKDGASVSQLFTNLVPNPANVTVRKSTGALTLPILGDLDGDGSPSCGSGRPADFGDLAAFCKLPSPFPACDPPGRSLRRRTRIATARPTRSPGTRAATCRREPTAT